jgi:hypothetical protein
MSWSSYFDTVATRGILSEVLRPSSFFKSGRRDLCRNLGVSRKSEAEISKYKQLRMLNIEFCRNPLS